MTQEDKELLLKDLCARLPYGVKCQIKGEEDFEPLKLKSFIQGKGFYAFDFYIKENLSLTFKELDEFKPYLFPLSSMTEEQKNQLKEIWDTDMNKALDYAISGEEGLSDLFQLSAAKKVINWFIKNHFDFQGLIPKELAIDCTNLNVY